MDESKELFFKELEELYIKHNLTIGHEDCHGGFTLEPYGEYNIKWMKEASDERGK